MKRWIWLLVVVALLASCGETSVPPTDAPASPLPSPEPAGTPTPASQMPASGQAGWWQDAVFYEVFVRSFYDSNGDGIGDLPGLIQKLDYLNDGNPATGDDLGVTALWLMPIFDSPSYHGYDTTDYYTINPKYGTNEDFQRLMDEAHQRGIQIIVDLVLNHSSVQHPWSVDSASGPEAKYRDWYVWSEENPGYLGPWGQKVWHAKNGSHYYGVFWDGMPDLNLENPAVTEQLYDIARFWLEEMGADGYRLDAVKHYVEDGKQQVHTEMTHAWLTDFHTFVQGVAPAAFTVGEAWDMSTISAKYVPGDVDAVFEFSLAEAILDGLNRRRASPIYSSLKSIQRAYPEKGYATFLTNHDQDRVMNALGRDTDKAKAAAAALLTLPGIPFLYYGEEIGMTGTKPDELIRTPMQWEPSESAGFTSGRPWEPVNEGYDAVNVKSELADPDSLLNHYRTLIALRQAHPALNTGATTAANSADPSVLAFVRYAEEGPILVVINVGDATTAEYAISLAESPLDSGTYSAADLLAGGEAASINVGAGGAVEGYQPLPELEARRALILYLSSGGE